MKKITYLIILLLTLSLKAGQAQQAALQDKTPYPNELPNLKLYHEAKWNSIQPYVSSVDDVVKLLGEPVPVYDNLIHGFVGGYESDPDWTIVIDILDKDPDLPDSVRGHVLSVTLYPKKRVPLSGADFSAFSGYTYKDSRDPNVGGTVYYDKFGLRYSVYAKDTIDGRFRVGDLQQIIYGPSNEETEKYSKK
jgi:hypothetical protein